MALSDAPQPLEGTPEGLRALSARLGEGVLDPSGQPRLGIGLLWALDLRAEGRASSEGERAALQQALACSAADIAGWERFAEAWLGAAAGQRCQGLMCRLHGAERLAGLMDRLLAHHGLKMAIEEVFCLENCRRGPSLQGAELLFSARGPGCEERPSRDWRGPAEGTVSLDDDSVPSRD